VTDDPNRNSKGQFVVGSVPKQTGRRKGARNRLHADFVVALQEHFAERGATAIEIVFRESPKEYLKIIASILPKEFILEDGRLESMGDEELAEDLAEIRRLKLARAGQDRSEAGRDRDSPGGGTKTPLN
jgi:hypothetical protein